MKEKENKYKLEKLGRIMPEENNGIGVSTVLTSDCGYETALLDGSGAHPVERYETREEAIKGHEKWVEFAKDENNKIITKLWILGEEEQVTLKRVLTP